MSKDKLYYCICFLLLLLTSCSGCKNKQEQEGADATACLLDRVTEEKLAQHKPAKRLEMNGSSDAFKLRPCKEMIISANKGAFDYNPHMEVNPVPATTLQVLDEQISRETGSQLLFAYDIDAGLPHDYVLPGSYTVKIDLRQKGVPEILWSHICAYRSGEGNVLQRLNIQVEDGILTYAATQNSVVSFCCESPFVGALLGLPTLAYLAGKPGLDNQIDAICEATGWPENWWKYKDWVNLFIRDKYGDFYIHFRYSKTEWGDKAKDMVDNMEQLNALTGQHYNNALTTYLKKHPDAAKTWNDDNPQALARYRMGVDSIFYENMKNDDRVKALEMTIPPSIQDIIKGMRLSERFARSKDGLQLQALPYVYDVYVVNSRHTGKVSKAISQSVPLFGTFLAVNYDHIYTKKGEKFVYNKDQADKVLISMGHELSHLYEYSYLVQPLVRDNRFIEALGALSEHWFARWLKKHGYISIDPDSKEAVEALDYANQTFKELYAWPFGKEWPKGLLGIGDVNTEGGYMLGTFVQYLCDNVPGGDKVTFDHMMRNYSVDKGFYRDMIDIFGIKNKGEFAKYFEGYCRKYIKEIVNRQKSHMATLKIGDSPSAKNVLFPTQFHKHYTCVKRFDELGFNGTQKGEPFTIRLMQMYATKDPADKTLPYVVFAVPSERVQPSEVYFTLLDGEDHKPAKDRYFIAPWKNAQGVSDRIISYGVVITRPDAANAVFDYNYYIDLVAFYQPDYEPAVRGRSKDGAGLNIDTGPTPTYDLLSHGYVTGMQLAVVNHKTGKSKTFNVPLRLCGKTVKLDFAKMGITNPDDIDISVRSRWYYKHPNGKTYYSPATDRVNYRKQKEKVTQKTEKVKPEEEDIKTTGNDEVNEDQGVLSRDVVLTQLQLGLGSVQYKYHSKPEDDLSDVRAHLVVKDGKFRLDVPPQSLKWQGRMDEKLGKCDENSFEMPMFSVLGDVEVKPYTSDGRRVDYCVKGSTVTITPTFLKVVKTEKHPFNKLVDSKRVKVDGKSHYENSYELRYHTTTSTYELAPAASPTVEDFYLTQFMRDNKSGGKPKPWLDLKIELRIDISKKQVVDDGDGAPAVLESEKKDAKMYIQGYFD